MARDLQPSLDLRAHWRRLTACCLAVLAAGFLLPNVLPEPKVQENRKLAEAPAPPKTWAELRAWPKAMDAYVADKFPARKQLIGGLNYLRYRLGVSGSERVIVGRDGWLFYDAGDHFGEARNDPAYPDAAAADWLLGLAGRTEWLNARGARYFVLLSSDKEVIEPQHGPSWYHGPDPNRPAALLTRLNRTAQAGVIVYPAPTLQQQARWGLKVYNPYETHWTGLGAYAGYVGLMLQLSAAGITEGPKPLSAFNESDARTKPANLSRMLGIGGFVHADYPQFVDPTVTRHVTWLTPKQVWSAPQVVDTGLAGKPVLLLLRDSFGSALLPFLEGHFSRIILVHNQDGFWRPELVERFHPDVVVTEVVESGTRYVMAGSPPPSDAARARIAAPQRVNAQAAPRMGAGPAAQPPVRRITGGPGDDLLHGTGAGELINGLAGNDTINGREGDDVVRGGRGDDWVSGGKGGDWVSGDLGDDTLTGGQGADVFRFGPGSGNDLVRDFSIADGDRVELPAGVAHIVRQQGADTVVELPGGRLTLRGVRADGLPAGWIVLR